MFHSIYVHISKYEMYMFEGRSIKQIHEHDIIQLTTVVGRHGRHFHVEELIKV
jgi:hypothetical protein